MPVRTPPGHGEDSWHGVPGTMAHRSGTVMKNGGNTVEAGPPSCPLFTEPRGREEGPAGEGQLQFLLWEWPVPT